MQHRSGDERGRHGDHHRLRRAARQIRHEAERAQAHDSHVSDGVVVARAQLESQRFAGADRAGERRDARELQDRRLIGDDVDDHFGERPFVAVAIRSVGAHGRRSACGQHHVGAIRGSGGEADGLKVLREADGRAGFVDDQQRFDRNGSAGHRRAVVREAQRAEVRPDGVQRVEGGDSGRDHQVARQIAHP